jgi:hypothetical protein
MTNAKSTLNRDEPKILKKNIAGMQPETEELLKGEDGF